MSNYFQSLRKAVLASDIGLIEETAGQKGEIDGAYNLVSQGKLKPSEFMQRAPSMNLGVLVAEGMLTTLRAIYMSNKQIMGQVHSEGEISLLIQDRAE